MSYKEPELPLGAKIYLIGFVLIFIIFTVSNWMGSTSYDRFCDGLLFTFLISLFWPVALMFLIMMGILFAIQYAGHWVWYLLKGNW